MRPSVVSQVIDLTRSVGAFIDHEGRQFDRSRIEQKQRFNNLVSYVDHEAERRLVAGLSKILPDAGFITEEGTVQQAHEHEYTWIIDPLDGTTNFLHGLPVYAISIALVKKGRPVLGVILDIARSDCFHAAEDGNAYCNDRTIRVSAASQLGDSLLATGFPYYHFEKQDAYLTIIKNFLEQSHGVRRIGSAAIDLAYVACGRFEGFFEYNLNPWDVAAGALIVQQAGGRVTDFKGGDNYLFGGELCASNTGIHDAMLETIKTNW
jgi:myo-inositol-1(or 4)-monophosphatase